MRYQIVGDDEADIRQGLVSVNSPIARALIGKSSGDEVEVAAPGGTRSFEVLAVRLALTQESGRSIFCNLLFFL